MLKGKNISVETGKLTEMQYYVTQQAGTEPPFSGKLLHNQQTGKYHCVCCGASLFSSESKFDAGCGWPSFYQPIDETAMITIDDVSQGMKRIEVRCRQCHAHLGHVFPDGPLPTGLRYCINSVSLCFVDEEDQKRITG